MEARREIAVATTNSVSGLIDSGRIVERTNEFTAASTVVAGAAAPQITAGVVRLAPWIDRLLAAAGLLCCAGGGRRRVRLAASATDAPDGPDISPDSATAEAPVTASR